MSIPSGKQKVAQLKKQGYSEDQIRSYLRGWYQVAERNRSKKSK